MFRNPDPNDFRSLPFDRFGNIAPTELSVVPTLAIGALAEPSVTNSLYLVQNSRLWRTDEASGSSVALATSNWSGSTSAAVLGGTLYIIQLGVLYRVDPATGASWPVGGEVWSGATSMTALGSRLFVAQGGSIWLVDDLTTGHRSLVGNAGTWPEVTSMSSMPGLPLFSGNLYVIENRYLWRVSPNTGAYTPLGGPAWPGPTTMTAIGSKLYITQDSALWVVDNLTTGAYRRLGAAGAWAGATSMTNLNGRLYIVQDEELWTVDPDTGAYSQRDRPWLSYAGPTVMAAMP